MAVEKIIIELIQNGEIKRGLRSKDFLRSQMLKKQNEPEEGEVLRKQQSSISAVSEASSFAAKKGNNSDITQKIVHKMSKKMQGFLSKDKFLDACEVLCNILTKKKPDWNEVRWVVGCRLWE